MGKCHFFKLTATILSMEDGFLVVVVVVDDRFICSVIPHFPHEFFLLFSMLGIFGAPTRGGGAKQSKVGRVEKVINIVNLESSVGVVC